MEQLVQFDSGRLKIEGLMETKSGDKGVVITHPHPLYGGNMYNAVVEGMTDAYQKHDYTTLRFNFRGVGESHGRYDDGIGEQEDVRSAINYLSEAGLKSIHLAGYSFGSWINAQVVGGSLNIHSLIMVSPPVGFVDFNSVGELPSLKLVVTGSEDDIAPVDKIREMIVLWNKNARLEIIEGADHFYAGYGDSLISTLISAF